MIKPGNWGTNMIIITPVLYKRVSCATCVHYDDQDGSCLVKPIIPHQVGSGYWKKCKLFDLRPSYYDQKYIAQVKNVKGSDFFTRKKPEETKGLSKKEKETGKRTDPDKTIVKRKKEFASIEKGIVPAAGNIGEKTFTGRLLNTLLNQYGITMSVVNTGLLKEKHQKLLVNIDEMIVILVISKFSSYSSHPKFPNHFCHAIEKAIKVLNGDERLMHINRWIVIPEIQKTNEISFGEDFYYKKGHLLNGVRLAELNQDNELQLVTGPIFEYWTPEAIKNTKIWNE